MLCAGVGRVQGPTVSKTEFLALLRKTCSEEFVKSVGEWIKDNARIPLTDAMKGNGAFDIYLGDGDSPESKKYLSFELGWNKKYNGAYRLWIDSPSAEGVPAVFCLTQTRALTCSDADKKNAQKTVRNIEAEAQRKSAKRK